MKSYMSEFRAEDVEFAAIFEDDFVVEVEECSLSWVCLLILYESFPDFGFFKDEYFDYSSVGTEKLVQVIMSDDIAKLVVDADEQNWSFGHFALLLLHN